MMLQGYRDQIKCISIEVDFGEAILKKKKFKVIKRLIKIHYISVWMFSK